MKILINFYRHLTNTAFVCLVGILIAGTIAGCTLEGDTYSGTVTNSAIECNEASTTTGTLNCGTGEAVDDHMTDNSVSE